MPEAVSRACSRCGKLESEHRQLVNGKPAFASIGKLVDADPPFDHDPDDPLWGPVYCITRDCLLAATTAYVRARYYGELRRYGGKAQLRRVYYEGQRVRK